MPSFAPYSGLEVPIDFRSDSSPVKEELIAGPWDEFYDVVETLVPTGAMSMLEKVTAAEKRVKAAEMQEVLIETTGDNLVQFTCAVGLVSSFGRILLFV
jgi:hypothetical protein